MKLSEAIRLGSMIRPQALGEWTNDEGGTCALSAALEAVGQLRKNGDHDKRVRKIWAWLKWPLKTTRYPECTNMGDLIMKLNDAAKASREAIADYVMQIERGLEERLGLTPLKDKPVGDLESHLYRREKAKAKHGKQKPARGGIGTKGRPVVCPEANQRTEVSAGAIAG